MAIKNLTGWRFCVGWHFNTLIGFLRISQRRKFHEPYDHISWDLQVTDFETLKQGRNVVTPTIVIMGNSIKGCNTDYIQRVHGKDAGFKCSRPHKNRFCAENSRHVSDLLSADHDHLSTAFFAAHQLYPFPVEGMQTEQDIIQSLIECHIRHDASHAFRDAWGRLRSEADSLGVGKGCLGTIGWQHIFTETRYGLAMLLEKWLAEENLMILSAQ